MAARLKRAFNVEAKLIEGGGGIFDVVVDGQLLHSKHETGQFPDEAALVRRIRSG